MGVLPLQRVPDVSIRGGALAFPDRVLTNEDVLRWIEPGWSAARVSFAAEGVAQTMGMRERAWARIPGDASSDLADTADLATEAGRKALEDADVAPEDVDVLIVATSTPPRWTSTVCSAVGGRLGLRAPGFDLRSGCAGALFALTQAAAYVAQGARNALVIGADTFSKTLSARDRLSALAMADGAAAVVVGRGPGGLKAAALLSDGGLGRLVHTPGVLPPTAEDVAEGRYTLHGDPERLPAVVLELYGEVVGPVLDRVGGAVGAYVPHQSGRPVLHAVADRFGLPRERVFDVVGRHANTGAASALGALVEARREGFLRAGEDVLIASVGGGMSAAAVVWTC